MKICVLASGSSGNCTYVASGTTQILIDAGLSCREIARRLDSIDVDLSDVDAVCLTHEHDDHRSALGVLHRRLNVALYGNAGTINALGQDRKLTALPWNVFTTGSAFQIGDISLEPFSVPHDSYDPVGFVASSGNARVGIVTDMGMPTELIRERLRHCHAVIVEANHDEQMLRDAARPWSLKQRIAGRQGHLSNAQAAELLAEIAGPQLKVALLAHLSSDCNEPRLALDTVKQALAQKGHHHVSVLLTYADRRSEIVNGTA